MFSIVKVIAKMVKGKFEKSRSLKRLHENYMENEKKEGEVAEGTNDDNDEIEQETKVGLDSSDGTDVIGFNGTPTEQSQIPLSPLPLPGQQQPGVGPGNGSIPPPPPGVTPVQDEQRPGVEPHPPQFPPHPPPGPYHGDPNQVPTGGNAGVQPTTTGTDQQITTEMSGENVSVTASEQSAAQTLQDSINAQKNAIEKEIADIKGEITKVEENINKIRKKISEITDKIESGDIDAINGAAEVKANKIKADMNKEHLQELQKQLQTLEAQQMALQQQGAMLFGQGMQQVPPQMMNAPQSPQGMPLPMAGQPMSPYAAMMMGPPMTPNPPMMGPPMSPYPPMMGYPMTPSEQPMGQPNGMDALPQQMGSEGATTLTEEEAKKAADEAKDALEEEEATSEDTSETGGKESSTNQVMEKNSPYSETHNKIFADLDKNLVNPVERKKAENLESFNLDTLFKQMEIPFGDYLFKGTKEEIKTDAYKPYDEIIEALFNEIKKCKEAYSRSADLYKDDTTCLAYKKTICECIQDWDSAIVKAFNEGISKVKGSQDKGTDSNRCYQEARALMARLENVIQADAYAGFYIESVKAIFGENIDDDDDDNALSSKTKLFKGDGQKYDIETCYVATARTINNLIEVIKFMRGDNNVVREVTIVEDLYKPCINMPTAFATSSGNFRRMPDKLQDIINNENTVFGSAANNVNKGALKQSIRMLKDLIRGLNDAKKEDQLPIEGHLKGINGSFCKIPSNSADYKFNHINDIMTGILTDGDYDSHNKMFRSS